MTSNYTGTIQKVSSPIPEETRKALLVRVAIDTGAGGALGPIFPGKRFGYIPIPEGYSTEKRKYINTPIFPGGKMMSDFVPTKLHECTMHFDPEFETYTYGDHNTKARALKKLKRHDMLVFYAGLRSTWDKSTGLYIIGYFTIAEIYTGETIYNHLAILKNNAHLKRRWRDTEIRYGVVIARGTKSRSRLLRKAIKISQVGYDKNGRRLLVVHRRITKRLGIQGAIQRSVPPRTIQPEYFGNLLKLLSLD